MSIKHLLVHMDSSERAGNRLDLAPPYKRGTASRRRWARLASVRSGGACPARSMATS